MTGQLLAQGATSGALASLWAASCMLASCEPQLRSAGAAPNAESEDKSPESSATAEKAPEALGSRGGDPPPVLARSMYEFRGPPLLALRELRARAEVVRRLPPNTFVPKKSYRLSFQSDAPLGGKVQVIFREPQDRSFRTFEVEVPSRARGGFLEFDAPAFTERAELRITPTRGELRLRELTLSLIPPRSQTEPIRSYQDSYVPKGYGLVFNDEFEGGALDRAKWFTRYIYASETLDRLGDEKQRYRDNDNHVISGGVLKLVARKVTDSDPQGVNYESGMIRSDFTIHYGFFETRVKMPGGLGVFPAFWLNSDVSRSGRMEHPPEIDIFEFVNNGKDDTVDKIHIAASAPPGYTNRVLFTDRDFDRKHRTYRAPFHFNEGFHTIGCEWTPETITTYVDGKPIVRTTFRWVYDDGELGGPAHVLLNLAIGGNWAGRYGIDDSAFPQALEVDWVRVYQRMAEAPVRTVARGAGGEMDAGGGQDE